MGLTSHKQPLSIPFITINVLHTNRDTLIHSFIQQELTGPQLRAQHCTRQRQIRHNPCRRSLMEKAATDKGKSTWRGTCADRSAPVRRPCPAPPSHPIPLATSQSGIHPTLSLPLSPDPNTSPLFFSGLQTPLTPPAARAATPPGAAGTGNTPQPHVVPGTRRCGTLLFRSAPGEPVLQNTTRPRFLLGVGCHSREQHSDA